MSRDSLSENSNKNNKINKENSKNLTYHREHWQAPDVPAELAKRVICACIREICFFRFSMGPKVINFRHHF